MTLQNFGLFSNKIQHVPHRTWRLIYRLIQTEKQLYTTPPFYLFPWPKWLGSSLLERLSLFPTQPAEENHDDDDAECDQWCGESVTFSTICLLSKNLNFSPTSSWGFGNLFKKQQSDFYETHIGEFDSLFFKAYGSLVISVVFATLEKLGLSKT